MAKCIIVGCRCTARSRGLCRNCYQAARLSIRAGKTTWLELIERCLAKEARPCARSAFAAALEKAKDGDAVPTLTPRPAGEPPWPTELSPTRAILKAKLDAVAERARQEAGLDVAGCNSGPPVHDGDVVRGGSSRDIGYVPPPGVQEEVDRRREANKQDAEYGNEPAWLEVKPAKPERISPELCGLVDKPCTMSPSHCGAGCRCHPDYAEVPEKDLIAETIARWHGHKVNCDCERCCEARTRAWNLSGHPDASPIRPTEETVSKVIVDSKFQVNEPRRDQVVFTQHAGDPMSQSTELPSEQHKREAAFTKRKEDDEALGKALGHVPFDSPAQPAEEADVNPPDPRGTDPGIYGDMDALVPKCSPPARTPEPIEIPGEIEEEPTTLPWERAADQPE